MIHPSDIGALRSACVERCLVGWCRRGVDALIIIISII